MKRIGLTTRTAIFPSAALLSVGALGIFGIFGTLPAAAQTTPPGLSNRPSEVDRGVDLLPTPRPDLGNMEGPARLKIESMQRSLSELLTNPKVSSAELAEAFGYLGQLLHAFQLLDSADDCYENASRLAAADYRWRYFLGVLAHQRGELETAVERYRDSLFLKTDDFPSTIRLADALLELGRGDESAERYNRALELDPGNAAALYGLGRVSTQQGDAATAVVRFEQALEIQPQASAIHYPLGQAYRKLGDLEKAREHLVQRGQQEVAFNDPLGVQVTRLSKGNAMETVLALASDEENFSEAQFLGFALSQFGDVKGAIEQLKVGLAVFEESAEVPDVRVAARVRYVLGGLLVNDGRDEEAIDQFVTAIELDPTLVDTRIKLGNALARSNRFAEAKNHFDRVLEMDPENAVALLKRAAVHMELKEDQKAIADLERLLRLDPGHREGHMRLADALARTGDLAAAVERLEQATALELTASERLSVLLRLAELQESRGLIGPAAERYQQALAADPESVAALGGLGSLLARLRRFQEAQELYAKWIVIEPEQLQPRVAEIALLIFDNRHTEALERLEAGLGVFPDAIQLKDILARHLAAAPDRSIRDGARAVTLAEEVLGRLPTPQSAETLAMAYAEARRFEDAVDLQQEVIQQIGAEAQASDVARLRANLELYQSRKPCCAEDTK